MGIAKRLTRNTGFVFMGRIVDTLFVFVSFAYAARVLGPSDFGIYALIGTFMFFISVFSAFGINPVAVREISRHRDRAEEIFSLVISLKVLFFLVVYPVVVLTAYGLGFGDKCKNLIPIAGIAAGLSLFSDTFGALYMGLEMFQLPMVVRILVSFLHCASNILVLYLGYGLEGMVWVSLFGSAAGAAISGIWVRKKIIRYRFRFDFAGQKDIIMQSLPFFVVAFLQQAHSYTTILLLSVLPGPIKGTVAVGYYKPPMSICRSAMIFPQGFRQAALPTVAANAEDRKLVTNIINRSTQTFMAVIIFPLILATTFFPNEIITLAFGAAYLPSAKALTILGWAFSLQVFNSPVSVILAASREIRQFVPWAGLVFCINLVLSVPLIMYYSFVGAAIAFLISRIVETMIRHHLLRVIWGIETVRTQKHLSKSVFMILMTCLVLGVAQTFSFSSLVLLIMTVLLYTCCVLCFREFREGFSTLVNGMIGRRLA